MSHGRGRITACVSIAALSGALYLGCAEQSRSQPTWPIEPRASQPEVQVGALTRDQVKLLVSALDGAEAHGFRADAFGQSRLKAMLASSDASVRAEGEARLQRAIIAYARAQRGLRVPTSAFQGDWAIRPGPYDAESDFKFALAQGGLDKWLAGLAPPFQRYRDLQGALAHYKDLERAGGWPAIPEGPALKPGANDPRVPILRRRVAAEGGNAGDLASTRYDPGLAASVAVLQRRYGLDGDGVLGVATLAAFNTPVEARVEQIAANMERWRWMPRIWPQARIEVNIPSANLTVFDANRPVTAMKVAVGSKSNRTPMLQSEIHSIVLNPPWNVPKSIASKELVPKGAGYLSRNNFRWVSDGAGGSRLQQRPGPGNSLGRIKFDFRNDFGVYLHDTSAKGVFDQDVRSVSHGCVRVERPEELAAVLMERTPGWDLARIDTVLQDVETVRAPLEQRWPVIIAYWTVSVDEGGSVIFYNDIYGWDREVAKLANGGGIEA